MSAGTWNVERAAEAFGVQPNTIREWVRQGMPVVKRGSRGAGNETLIDEQEARAWVDARQAPADELAAAFERLHKAKADVLEIRRLLLEGELVDLEERSEWVERAFQNFRLHMLGLGSKVATRLVVVNELHAGDRKKRRRAADELLKGLLAPLVSQLAATLNPPR